MMDRSDFRVVARITANAIIHIDDLHSSADFLQGVCDILSAQYMKFDRDKFYALVWQLVTATP